MDKKKNPPKYPRPTVIYTEAFKMVDGVAVKGYTSRQNFKSVTK